MMLPILTLSILLQTQITTFLNSVLTVETTISDRRWYESPTETPLPSNDHQYFGPHTQIPTVHTPSPLPRLNSTGVVHGRRTH